MGYPVSLNDRADDCHENSVRKGFWTQEELDLIRTKLSTRRGIALFLSKIALIHSEASEATEAARENDRAGVGEELADIVIRVFDLAGACKINIEQEIIDKMLKNESRPKMHGKLA